MASLLFRVGHWCAVHRWTTITVWVLVLAGALGGGWAMHGSFTDDFVLPATNSSRVLGAMDKSFPDAHFSDGTATAIVQVPAGQKITDQRNTAQIRSLESRLTAIDGVRSVLGPEVTGAVSLDSQAALIQIQFDTVPGAVSNAQKTALQEAAASARADGITVEFGGAIYQGVPAIGISDTVGLIAALIVLVIALGGLVAAVLPIASAIAGVGIGVGGVLAASGLIELSQLTPLMPVMLGLAVGIDYSLFIISRYQNELADGHPRTIAAGRAVGTAGTAVVFAGLTVVIALAALSTARLSLLTAMGIATAATVLASILIALTLTPALLAVAGRRIKARLAVTSPTHAARANTSTIPVREGRGSADASSPRHGLAARWVNLITRAPAITVIVTLVVLGVLTVPAFQMRLNFPDNSMAAANTTQHKASTLIAGEFGPGYNGPLIVYVTGRNAKAAATAIATSIHTLENVQLVAPPVTSSTNTAAYLQIIPKHGPLDTSTSDLVHTLRDHTNGWASDTGAQSVSVTGQVAIAADASHLFASALIPYMALVVVFALILLMLMFRSILVPLKAAIGFLFSIGATLGITVAVFQWGWGDTLIGLQQPGPIVSLLPLALTGILFGLAMDYEVFIVSRIREERNHTADPTHAVRAGFVHSARVVFAAAIIMISVFAGFITIQDTLVKSIAFALAIGVFIDALLVRMTLVPAIMTLLGRTAWWLPRRLDRRLPNFDTEGTTLINSSAQVPKAP